MLADQADDLQLGRRLVVPEGGWRPRSSVQVLPGPGSLTPRIQLYAGRVKGQLLAVRSDGRLLVDQVAAKGDIDTGPVTFQDNRSRRRSRGHSTTRGQRTLDGPWYKQAFPLSCESASLWMTLAYRGIATTDAAILEVIGSDSRPAYFEGDGRMR